MTKEQKKIFSDGREVKIHSGSDFISMAKDLLTPMGIPLHNIENIEAYKALASKISSTFFIKKQWLQF